MDRTWYKDFFRGIVNDVWQDAVTEDYTRDEVNFLERTLRLVPGQAVLDVPCGFGRHCLALAQRGYHMTGIDASEEMLAKAKASGGKAAEVTWICADMNNLELDSSFDAAFCFGNSFGYLDRDGTLSFLDDIARCLPAGARFAFDYGLAAECILPRFCEREWGPIDDMLFLEHNQYRLEDSCIETTYTFVHNGTKETRTGLHWVYTVREIRELLAAAGFATVSLFQSTAEEAFKLGATVLIVLAEKR